MTQSKGELLAKRSWMCEKWRSRPHSEQLASAKFIHSNQRAEFGYALSVGGGDAGGSLLNSLLIVSILSVKQETATSLPWSWRFGERRKGVDSVGEQKRESQALTVTLRVRTIDLQEVLWFTKHSVIWNKSTWRKRRQKSLTPTERWNCTLRDTVIARFT